MSPRSEGPWVPHFRLTFLMLFQEKSAERFHGFACFLLMYRDQL